MKKFLTISSFTLAFCLTAQVFASEKMTCKDTGKDTSSFVKNVTTDSEFELTLTRDPLSVSAVLTKPHTLDAMNLIDKPDFTLSECALEWNRLFSFECANFNKNADSDDFDINTLMVNFTLMDIRDFGSDVPPEDVPASEFKSMGLLMMTNFAKESMYTYTCYIY